MLLAGRCRCQFQRTQCGVRQKLAEPESCAKDLWISGFGLLDLPSPRPGDRRGPRRTMTVSWPHVLRILEGELTPQQYNTWIRPLTAAAQNAGALVIHAPNKF